MQKLLFISLLFLSAQAMAQSKFSKHEFSINGFRNPSVGLEYRYKSVSVHAGYYPTIISQDENDKGLTTSFLRTGLSLWFLPIGKKENPSSFYASASYLRGFDREYKDENAAMLEAGFRWMIWKGLNVRIGAAVLMAKDRPTYLNPTPGISYSFFSKN
ncbi:MAG: hypothetical protein SFU99_11560 [Saprospiraceae bacterium]|nr:hypothetical protein [Saprospiraceae bacterium]